MTSEEQLREEKSQLQEQVRMQQEVIERQSQQIAQLTAQVEDLQARLSKDSHNSHLPPSSDRFKRQPKSLRKKSGKKAGGQPGHRGEHLQMVETPDQVISQPTEDSPIAFRLIVGSDFNSCKSPGSPVAFPTPTPTLPR